MKLTQEQKHVILEVLKFNKDIQCVSGYAGTGKTTCIRHLIAALPNFAVCAFTGKAAQILRRKGIASASTIHSLIYKPIKDFEGNVFFALADSLDCEGIIIDEASMVSKEIYDDLCSFDLPMIFVGDHGQLEPVGQDVYLMKNPDFKLEEIHRNAGEIAHFAEFIRKGYRPAAFANKSPKNIKFIEKSKLVSAYKEADIDQVICAFNKTRVGVNEDIRNILFMEGNWPYINEKVMCLRNNHAKGLFNGMQGIVKKVGKYPKNQMTFRAEEIDYNVSFDPSQFGKEKYDFSGDRDDPDPFDFAYCITCHKCQGDEWENIMVIEQKCDLWDHRRWCYTAASRAKESIRWIV